MGCLAGFIVTFLGASIFNLLGGVPFIPLQTLYINFTTQVFEAIGLGYGKPGNDLMKQRPRPSTEPILDRAALMWLSFAGLILGATTLGVIAWANDHRGEAIAHTMGMTTFAIANVYWALTVKDDRRSVFSLDTFDDRRLVLMTGMSAVAILLGTQLGLLNRLLDTVGLDLHEWLICIASAATIVVVSEIRKFMLRRREAQNPDAGADAVAADAVKAPTAATAAA
jgi:Ca2+-transporting ATPase